MIPTGVRTCAGCGGHWSGPWYRAGKTWWCNSCVTVEGDPHGHPVPPDLPMVHFQNRCHVLAPDGVGMFCGHHLERDLGNGRYALDYPWTRPEIEALQVRWSEIPLFGGYRIACQRCVRRALATYVPAGQGVLL